MRQVRLHEVTDGNSEDNVSEIDELTRLSTQARLHPSREENSSRPNAQSTSFRRYDPEDKKARAAARKSPLETWKEIFVTQLTPDEIAAYRREARKRNVKMPPPPVGSLRENARDTRGAISILEELFGEELRRQPESREQRREVPKGPVGYLDDSHQRQRARSEGTFSDKVGLRRPHISLNKDTTVLILRKASKHLTEQDFRRLIPGGRHIEGWTGLGELMRVVRARVMKTLERDGEYFLVFSNSTIAFEYKRNIFGLHSDTQKELSNNQNSVGIPPPPNLASSGKAAFDTPAYTYNLIPPTHDLTIKLQEPPFPPVLLPIVTDGAYARLLEDRRTNYEVMLWFESYWHPAFSVIRRAIDQDGKERGSFWRTVGDHSGLRLLAGEYAALGKVNGVATSEEAPSDWKGRRGSGSRHFIVSFRDEQEASRFALFWHRRDVTAIIEAHLLGPWQGDPIIANADATW